MTELEGMTQSGKEGNIQGNQQEYTKDEEETRWRDGDGGKLGQNVKDGGKERVQGNKIVQSSE